MSRRVTWSAIAAAIVVGFVLLVIVGSYGLGSGGGGGAQGGPEMTRAELRSLALGSSRGEVERAVGKGSDALEFSEGFLGATGEAVEPMDATCAYYSLPGGFFSRGPIQLCYRDDVLVSKRLYS
jgi:hypothetical protein